MSDEPRPLLEFPCSFPLKVIGRDDGGFEQFVRDLIARHVPASETGEVSSRPSGEGNYLSVTVTFTATSQEQIDRIYEELSAQNRVLMVL